MADAKSLRMDAARKALAEKRGRAIYPRSNPDFTQKGLYNLTSEVRNTDKSFEDNQKDASAMRALESHRRATKQAAPEVPYPFEQQYQDLRYSGRGMKDPYYAGENYTLSTMEDDDLELSRLIDRGSFGDVRPEMAEIAKQDADFIRQTDDATRNLRYSIESAADNAYGDQEITDLINDAETEDKKRQLRDRVKNQVLGR